MLKCKRYLMRNIYALKKMFITILFVIGVFAYLFFSEIDIVSPGEGIVTGENDKIEIKSPNSGFINDFNIREGDQVSKGMILFTYTNLDY
ncbi:hypothetical protein ATO59_25830, partial [Salmonella enterica subsp. enterica serovar Kentucky]|nr:hypothetical protein [Salmonella enterica subsp. enterica serovar Kentucky]HBJ2591205.1 hypothetical protein [Salmonella enterica]ECS2321127.1 hypothetical protein [Salmonella enterica subsp. enterica serovar Kentucky]EDK1662919.1 hypothetical protein [Salmonella enterica subsp. enterica serovar Kentucky]EDR8613560.1 hypothetical protein [Salmonella enterica subsp. enterica serovar Kentucky]